MNTRLSFSLPRTGHYKGEHYRLEAVDYGREQDAMLVESSARGSRLAKALNGQEAPQGWRLTPVRAVKWLDLFDAGIDFDERGFFVYADGGRYEKLSVALEVARDLRRAVV